METRTALAATAQPLCTVGLQRQGAGGLLWRAATPSKPQGLVFVLARPPMAAGLPAAGGENETSTLSCRREGRLRGKR